MIKNKHINRAIDYILEHINEDITVNDIAAHCNFSKYHFSRMFKTETGESIYSFIKRIKMQQSAFKIKIEKNRSITDIGSDYGYSSSNYSSAFKKHYNTSPIKFRKSIMKKSLSNPIFKGSKIKFKSFEECEKMISIENLEDYEVIFERYKGSYSDLAKYWLEFTKKYEQYITKDTLFFERTYDDPSITDINKCLFDIYITVPKNYKNENTCIIEGGKYAIYHFKGYAPQIYSTFQSFFNVWLPQSGYKTDERHGFDIYRKIKFENMYMEIDMCFPIK